MESLVKADVFFFVATICLVLLTVIFSIAGIYIIKMIQEARQVTRRVKVFQVFIKNLISRI